MSTGFHTKRTSRVPSLRECNGRGFVELNGKRLYLGATGTAATQEAYQRTVAEWIANGRRLKVAHDAVSVSELCLPYWEYCKEYYRRQDGTPTSHASRVRYALRRMRELYGSTRAADFGPGALRAVRNSWVDQGLARTTINSYVNVLRHMFKWAASHEHIPVSTYHALATVEGLKKGRTRAKEARIVSAVHGDHVEAVQPHLARPVWALIQLQLLTGGRSSELLMLRAIDLDMTRDVWVTRFGQHKTAHHGKSRCLHFGPKSQQILREFMADRPVDAYLFSPRDAERERHAAATTHRRPDQKSNCKKTQRTVGAHYRVDTYRRAIARACVKAGVPVWTPHQLRHTTATLVRKRYGLEAAQVVLGHSRADVTEIYAEADMESAVLVAREMG